ncbi:GNAT family N-acetyltransferase [Massilia sp. DD77]|uniref:GNAT family N-acetyltransferase n=1 Tax=Massilia sp. DD77 TaxID=3109349 RepID=UPI002FFEEC4E
MDMHSRSLVIRRFQAHEWPAYRAIRLRSLGEAPEAFCSTLATEEAYPLETWSERMVRSATAGIDCPLVAEMDSQPVGLVWAKADGDDPAVVNLFQMWVAPEARGRRVGMALLDEAIGWARSRGARAVRLSVRHGNAGAFALYEKAGFRETGEPDPAERKMSLDLLAK